MIAQKNRPLAAVRYVRRLLQDFHDRVPVLLGYRHVHARHERKVVRHMAFVAIAKIIAHILRPLVGFREQHASMVARVDIGTHVPDHGVRLRQILVARPFAHAQVRHCVETHAVDSLVEPETHHPHHRLHHMRVVVIEVRLMREKAVPVVRAGHIVPGPVRFFRVAENNGCAGKLLVAVAPDIEVALVRTCRCPARCLKPWVLVRGVIDHQFRDDAQPALVRCAYETAEVAPRSVRRMHVVIVGYVVSVIAQR